MRLQPSLRSAVLLASALLALASCAEQAPEASAPVAPAELAALLSPSDAPLLLDVRTPEEFAAGHVPGATLVPVQELEARLRARRGDGLAQASQLVDIADEVARDWNVRPADAEKRMLGLMS